MAAARANPMLSHLRSLAADELGDGQLLRNFAGAGDQAAFTAIVHRHGKLVLGVCRRVLGDGADSDDAFQATFVVLARKAASIRKHSSLGSWLYGVAYRIASDLRKQRGRRRQRESAAAAPLAEVAEQRALHTDPGLRASWREVGTILDEELQRLPADCRDALVVCLMQGLSHNEAARSLGWPLGTLKTRLERGRALLRQRLERRGLALSALALSVALSEQLAAAVPADLARAALRAAAPGACSARVAALDGAAARALPAGKMKLALLGALTACLLGVGAAALSFLGGGSEPGQPPLPPAVRAPDKPGQPAAGVAPDQHAAPNLPAGAVAVFGRLPYHNGARIEASELSADGKRLATLSRRSATVWDTATGEVLRRCFFAAPVRPGPVGGLALSPDGSRLACRPTGSSIVVWDLSSGKEVRRFTVAPTPLSFAFFRFTADGTALVAQVDEDVAWLNLTSGATDRLLRRVRIKQLSPDDRTFAVVAEARGQVLLGDARTGKILRALPVAAKADDMERGVLFLPDGVTLAVVHHMDNPAKEDYRKEVQFWDLTTGKRRQRTWSLPASDRREAYRLALSADGKVLYFPEDRKHIRRYDLANGRELTPLPLYGQWTTAALPHPDGKTLFAVHLEVIRRWDVAAVQVFPQIKDVIDWQETAISRDGRWLALGSYQGALELRDVHSGKGKRIDFPKSNGRTLAFSPGCRRLAVNCYDHVRFLSVPDLAGSEKLDTGAPPLGEATIQYSPDGRYLAALNSVGELRVFDLKTARRVWGLKETSKVLFTRDGKKMLVLPRGSDVLRLHEIAAEKAVYEVKLEPDRLSRRRGVWVPAWALSPDGRILAVARVSGHVCLLDAASGRERARFLAVPTDVALGPDGEYRWHATALAFSADGHWLAIGGEDGLLRIWDVWTRRELHRLHGHEGAATAVGFAADGRRLVSFGDGEGIVWDLRPTPGKEPADPFADLLSEEGPKVYRAAWALADDPAAPAKLREQIRPVRRDADAARVARLIADLGSARFAVRQEAQQALAELEGAVRPALLEALRKKPALETERRLRTLLETLDGDPKETALRTLRAVQILELQGSDAARRVLREWSEGTAGLRLTEAARAALGRLRSERK